MRTDVGGIPREPRTVSSLVMGLACVLLGAACARAPDDFQDSRGEHDSESASPDPNPSIPTTCLFTYENALDDDTTAIVAVHLMRAGSSELGENELGDDILVRGVLLEILGVAEGSYDTVAIDEHQTHYWRYDVPCEGTNWHWDITDQDAIDQGVTEGTGQ